MGIYKTVKTLITIAIVVAIIVIVLRMLKAKSDFGTVIGDELNRISKYMESKTNSAVDSTETNKNHNDIHLDDVSHQISGKKQPRRSGSIPKTSYKMEELCRSIFEDHFDDYFPTCRPKFLANPKTGRPLELDGYNPRLNLAFEYNGSQHYIYPNRFHKTREEFDSQLERDEFKKRRCEELGIKLITIPSSVKESELKSFIMNSLR